jgi:hypothetical protein
MRIFIRGREVYEQDESMHLSKRKASHRAKVMPAARTKKVHLAIECTPAELRQMKVLAASEDKTLNEFVLESARMRLKRCMRSHAPNPETTKALRDIENGENLIEFDSVEDFFNFLEK